MNVISSETRMMGPPYGEEIMIVGRTMWTQCTSATDGQTDRITITKTVQRRASHGKNQRHLTNAAFSANDEDGVADCGQHGVCLFQIDLTSIVSRKHTGHRVYL